MHKLWIIGIFGWLSCDALVQKNPDYCEESSVCAQGLTCDQLFHRCLPPPVLNRIEPALGPAVGNVDIIIHGNNFRQGMTVEFNDQIATITSITNDLIQVKLPPSPGACGPAEVRLSSAAGDKIQSSSLFRYRVSNIQFKTISSAPAIDVNAGALSAGRLDSDAHTDLIIANRTSQTVSVLAGVGDMTFQAAQDFGKDVYDYNSAQIADLDNDGINDILAVSSGKLVILQGKGNLQFSAVSPQLTYTYTSKFIGIYDINNDQKLDWLMLHGTQNQIDVYINNGTFSFVAQSPIALSSASSAIAVGDISGDGKADMVATDVGNSAVLLFLGNGDGNFSKPSSLPTNTGPQLLALADLNADGKKDLIIATKSGGQGSLTGAFGAGDGSFPNVVSIPIAATPQLLATDDFDCDGRADALVYNQATTELSLYLAQQEAMGFAPLISINTGNKGTALQSLAVARLDGDSKLDIALLTSASPPSLVLLQNTSN